MNYSLRILFRICFASSVIACIHFDLSAQNPLANVGVAKPEVPSPWTGKFVNSWGVSLLLSDSGNGAFSGDLSIDSGDATSIYPVNVNLQSGNRLEGGFVSGSATYPLTIEIGEEPEQIVVSSEGYIYELSREGAGETGGNPLAQSPSSGGVDSVSRAVGTKAYKHPDGFFSMSVPSNWNALVHSGDVIEFNLGPESPGGVYFYLGELDASEIGQPHMNIIDGIVGVMDQQFSNDLGFQSVRQEELRSHQVGSLSGSISKRKGDVEGAQVSIWQGTATKGNTAFILVALAASGLESGIMFGVEDAFNSLRVHHLPAPGFSERYAQEQSQAQGGFGSFSNHEQGQFGQNYGRSVWFNGKQLDGTTLSQLEEAAGQIPDGRYWYDKRSGMVGHEGGPTLAYLYAGIDFCPPIKSDASGGLTRVMINGRYIHPSDQAGLEMYLGSIQPGNYWIDSQGNYGNEGGPAVGNLLAQIAAVHQMLAQQYQEQPGAANQRGSQGGYSDAMYGGGSVYSHFPNLGAGGTGVSVSGSGSDTIVNAGGVLWWPGK